MNEIVETEAVKTEAVKTEAVKTEAVENNKKNTYFIILYDFCYKTGYYLYKAVVIFVKIGGIYVVWILLHYFSSIFYTKLCTPNSVWGLIMSPFLITTPYCQGLRWLIYNGANMINHMWLILATWLCANMFILEKIN